jgi:predicted TIM-barrel fold metal-dependent hydrolase
MTTPLPPTSRLYGLTQDAIRQVIAAAEALDGGAPELTAQLVGAFGATRICWGSDHPQTFEVPYPQMVALAMHATETLDAPARDAVLGGTTRRLWFGSH